MGALHGSISFLRFRVDGDPITASQFGRAIEARRFMPLSPTGEVSESAGWTSVMSPFDDELALNNEEVSFGERVVLTYREDKWAIPKPLVKRQLRRRLQEIERDEGKKQDEMGRAFIKAVEASVITELRSKMMPKTKLVEVVWTIEKHEVRVFAKGLIATERIASLFERTFKVQLNLAVPAVRALAIIGDNEKNFRTMVLVRPSLVFGEHR